MAVGYGILAIAIVPEASAIQGDIADQSSSSGFAQNPSPHDSASTPSSDRS
jgi:hypothetical protein